MSNIAILYEVTISSLSVKVYWDIYLVYWKELKICVVGMCPFSSHHRTKPCNTGRGRSRQRKKLLHSASGMLSLSFFTNHLSSHPVFTVACFFNPICESIWFLFFLQYLPPTATNTTRRLHELRAVMKTYNISAYIIPGTDAHLVAKFLSSTFLSSLLPLFPSYTISHPCSLKLP